ncbi:threonine/serine exporter family protein [Clostridium niameyense]|uniref:Threonine/serine exporter family protein n=1 Tax=Clostridium niameyense TaxID=1622073 RepID=A0A6M0R6S3_9CLOT|nr:threonine/serine exporter family protein [Clostridium niameyense]NEZ45952.1 threonine/serine exporter family protein [Clostridium niameyense]
MEVNKIIRVALEAGKVILENGGETYRAEETMSKICSTYNIKDSDNYVTPTVIMISATDDSGKPVSLSRRIKYRTVDLDKIDKINNLSRSIKAYNLSINEVEEEIALIKKGENYNDKLGILFSCFISSFFTLLFGGNFNDFLIAFVIGAALKLVLNFSNYLSVNTFFTNLLGGVTVASLTILSSLFVKNINIDKIIIGSIMILVPGIAIVNAIRDTIAGDLISGTVRAVEAFLIAIAIAVGTGLILKLWFPHL